jgi:hypothetical protein
MAEYQGRGAWSSKGVGGTLKKTTVKKVVQTVPGPYYMLHSTPLAQVGMRAFLMKYAGQPVDMNDDAVHHGVIAIQVLVAGLGIPCPIHGVYDVETDTAVRKAQGQLGLVADGVVGQSTMKKLLLPLIKRVAREQMNQDWRPIYGVLANEGAFDPGAVGFLDAEDLGLAQINMPSHPDVKFADAFCPSYAVKFVAGLLGQALSVFHDERDSIAAYNLGIGGTRAWIAAGRPDLWSPPHAPDRERNVKKYIDNILKASEGIA